MTGREVGERKLGTFLGVFTPTILTILGVILYLRTGWLVGHQGLLLALLVVVLSNGITLVTALSFSSVATNARVGVGGAYYIVSRSLGLETGGAIGLPLFLSQALSVTLYSFGLAESLRIVWPHVPVQIVACAIVLSVGALAFRGAGVALKTQLPVMVLVGLSLAALGLGAVLGSPGEAQGTAGPSGEVPFRLGFAVFFPAVTGVMAGLGLSGDLKDPQRSLPWGCILATLVGFVVYVAVTVVLAVSAGTEDLREDPLVWTRIAPLGAWLVLPGLWGAIFSSAVGSMLGAPRTLQALAEDHLAPKRLARLKGKKQQPVLALTVSLAIALGALALGDLNTVAPVVTMVFLTVYATVNIVAALETLSGDPSWRPRLRIPWPLSLAGGLGCLAAMFLINPVAGLAAVALVFGLWIYLEKKQHEVRWGDARRGLYEAVYRWVLMKLARRPQAPRNWRPHILVFTDNPARHLDLVRFANWFSQGRGVVTVCELIIGDLLEGGLELQLAGSRAKAQEVLDREGIVAFAEVDVVKELVEGITEVTQANGMAGMESNTVLLGWPKDGSQLVDFLRTMRRLEVLGKSMIIGRIEPRYLFPREGTVRLIDIWWGGLERNGDLMLLLAYLLHNNAEWSRARVRVMSIASNELTQQRTEQSLARLLPEVRIDAEPRVIVLPEDRTVGEVIRTESAESDVVFLGLGMPDKGDEESYAERLAKLSEGLGTVFFVRNSSPFGGELV